MEVVLLGTGGAAGWPNPFCECASCAGARAAGEVRGQTSALVDGVLLLDCGTEVPRAAARLGVPLSGVRHLLVTHGHFDHAGPSALLLRAWAGRTEPLDLVATEPVLDQVRPWLGPDDPVRLHPVGPGSSLALGGYDVRVLAAAHGDAVSGPGVLYDVTAPDGGRLLYATDTGPLPVAALEAVAGRAYDVVLLEESFGDVTDHGTQHLDLVTFPAAVAALREQGAVTDRTDVVAVHLGDGNPPTAELSRRLAAHGARVVPDGAQLGTGAGSAPVPRRGLRTLVLGGARSGKSAYAEAVCAGPAAADGPVTYVATGGSRPDDAEWAQRVAAHRARRPAGWRTEETTDLVPLLEGSGPADTLLVDCVALWLADVLDSAGAWDDRPGSDAAVAARCDALVAAYGATTARTVLVSNEVGSGVVPGTVSGRRYRDELGRLNARLAATADEVVLVVAGIPQTLRAAEPTLAGDL